MSERQAGSPAYFDATAQHWDRSYDAPTVRAHWWRTRLGAAVELIGDGPGTLLEVGAGPGRLLRALAERNWAVTGIDPAPRMVALARERVPAAVEQVTVGRAEAQPFADGSFDVVVAIGVLEYTNIEASLGEIARVLRPGGRAVLGLHNNRAPALVWQRAVMHPLARGLKRIVPFGRPFAKSHHQPLSPRRVRELLGIANLAVMRVEHVGCAAVPDPLDRLAPGLAYWAARRAEGSPALRRLLGTQRLILAIRNVARASSTVARASPRVPSATSASHRTPTDPQPSRLESRPSPARG